MSQNTVNYAQSFALLNLLIQYPLQYLLPTVPGPPNVTSPNGSGFFTIPFRRSAASLLERESTLGSKTSWGAYPSSEMGTMRKGDGGATRVGDGGGDGAAKSERILKISWNSHKLWYFFVVWPSLIALNGIAREKREEREGLRYSGSSEQGRPQNEELP